MEVMERAFALEAEGVRVIHLEIGEPDHAAPLEVIEATEGALRSGGTHYTDSRGWAPLREAVAEDKTRRSGVPIDPECVLVTSGTSPAMLMIFGLLASPGSEVVIPTPHYPCYPNFVRFFGATPVFVPHREPWIYDVEAIRAAVGPRTSAIVIASPANPTGAVQSAETLAEIASLEVPMVSDEIYDGLLFSDVRAPSALAAPGRTPRYVLDGFSKRYAMTGFRLGYAVVPRDALRALQTMQQNFFISTNEFVQRAGLAALVHGEAVRKAMVADYTRRRDHLIAGLETLGFRVPRPPDGAFYVFADAKRYTRDSKAFAFRLLEHAHVAVTPGVDFGVAGEGFLRFSLSASDADLDRALERIAKALPEIGEAAP